MCVIGLRKLDYQNKQGRQVRGVQIFAVNKIDPMDGQGYMFPRSGQALYISADKLDGVQLPQIDDEIDVSFDEYGRVKDFKIV